MTTQTLYHVTDKQNVDSILSEGLLADNRGFVFMTTTVKEAERVGDIYDTIDEPVVLAVEVMEHKIESDPDPHGDIESRAVRVHDKVPAYDVKVAK